LRFVAIDDNALEKILPIIGDVNGITKLTNYYIEIYGLQPCLARNIKIKIKKGEITSFLNAF